MQASAVAPRVPAPGGAMQPSSACRPRAGPAAAAPSTQAAAGQLIAELRLWVEWVLSWDRRWPGPPTIWWCTISQGSPCPKQANNCAHELLRRWATPVIPRTGQTTWPGPCSDTYGVARPASTSSASPTLLCTGRFCCVLVLAEARWAAGPKTLTENPARRNFYRSCKGDLEGTGPEAGPNQPRWTIQSCIN